MIYVFAFGLLLVILAIIFNALYLIGIFRGRRAHVRIAETGNYRLLVNDHSDVKKIFGGEINGHPFAFRPSIERSHGYSNGRRQVSIRIRMQILFPIFNPTLKDVSLVKRRKIMASNNFFDAIWATTPSPNSLPPVAKAAIYDFAAGKAHKRGLEGSTFRVTKRIRDLSIVEPSSWQHSLPGELFPTAINQLVYDHPNANLSLEEFTELIEWLYPVISSLEPQVVEAELVG